MRSPLYSAFHKGDRSAPLLQTALGAVISGIAAGETTVAVQLKEPIAPRGMLLEKLQKINNY